MKKKDEADRTEGNIKQLFGAFQTMQTNMLAIVKQVEELTAHVNKLEEAEEERKRAEG